MTTAQDKSPLDLRAIREELTGLHGEAYWERLGELSGREDFQAFLKAEFPSQAPRWVPDVQRRDFLRLAEDGRTPVRARLHPTCR